MIRQYGASYSLVVCGCASNERPTSIQSRDGKAFLHGCKTANLLEETDLLQRQPVIFLCPGYARMPPYIFLCHGVHDTHTYVGDRPSLLPTPYYLPVQQQIPLLLHMQRTTNGQAFVE